MSDSYVLIQGINPGQVPGIRKEFSSWATQNPETSIQVSLFIRALQRFYDVEHTNTLSYFQVASIHGYPGDLCWDKSIPPQQEKNDHYVYCTHNLITFPTWHRAYMLLFEQTIWSLMGDVIEHELEFNSNDEKTVWIDEKDKWRLPYWNWALKDQVPDLFMPSHVDIRVPKASDGSQPEPEQRVNPLYRYQLKVNGVETKMGDLPCPYKVDNVGELPWAECSGTSRWGIKSTKPDDWSRGVNNYPAVETAIKSHNWYKPDGLDNKGIADHPVCDVIYRLLRSSRLWRNFSSTAYSKEVKGDWKQWLSLEYIHNNLHGFIGGNILTNGLGHMQSVPVAAFDPIFYMHHCYIDSQFALWQTLYKDEWFQEGDLPLATDPLPPFRHEYDDKRVDYFDSNELCHWTKFGYQYDVLQPLEGEHDEVYNKRIRAWFDRTYNTTSQVLLNPDSQISQSAKIHGDTYDDYLIGVLYDRYALGGDAYTIHFFLGDISAAEVAARSTQTNVKHVGSVYNFSSPMRDQNSEIPRCANCAQQHDDGVLSTAQVPLTLALYNAAADADIPDIHYLDPLVIEPYLRRNLKWFAMSTGGTIIPWGDLSRTKIFVVKGRGQHFDESSRLSEYYNYTGIHQATDGKDAGASHDDYS